MYIGKIRREVVAEKIERTFIAIKPDAVNRGFIGEIITRFEKRGFKIIGMKLLTPSMEIAEKHYEEHHGKSFYNNLINFITEGPIVAMVIEGVNVIDIARKMMGATNPQDAAPGTIRFDFAQIKECNIIHGSDSPESATREISIYFKPEELFEAKKTPEDYFIEKYGHVE